MKMKMTKLQIYNKVKIELQIYKQVQNKIYT
jgi:hypothetical protein